MQVQNGTPAKQRNYRYDPLGNRLTTSILPPSGDVRYQLKTPYRDGTTHVIFEPLDFMARLAALVPRPRVNLTRYHGVFAPNSPWRGAITPGRRGRGVRPGVSDEEQEKTPAERRAAMTWSQRLKRVFGIDIETCPACGGAVRIIASIEDPAVIGKILAHVGEAEPVCGELLLRQPGAAGIAHGSEISTGIG